MQNHNPLAHAVGHAIRKAREDNSKTGDIVLIVIGLFFTPFLIGIPIALWGLIRLLKRS